MWFVPSLELVWPLPTSFFIFHIFTLLPTLLPQIWGTLTMTWCWQWCDATHYYNTPQNDTARNRHLSTHTPVPQTVKHSILSTLSKPYSTSASNVPSRRTQHSMQEIGGSPHFLKNPSQMKSPKGDFYYRMYSVFHNSEVFAKLSSNSHPKCHKLVLALNMLHCFTKTPY